MTCDENCDFYDTDRCYWKAERPACCNCQMPRAIKLDGLLSKKEKEGTKND